MRPYVYIETSVVSYLTARPSKDLIKLACQQITQSWWNTGRLETSHFISPYVIEEANAGDSGKRTTNPPTFIFHPVS